MKNVRDRINNWSDVLRENKITKEQFQERVKGLQPDEIGYIKEKLIVSAYNEGKLPDWQDGTSKYYPWFRMSRPGVGFASDDYAYAYSDSLVGSRLCFVGDDAYENMRDAANKFLPEYKESRTL